MNFFHRGKRFSILLKYFFSSSIFLTFFIKLFLFLFFSYSCKFITFCQKSRIRKAIDFYFPSIGKNILSTIKLLLDININPFEKDIYNQSAYDIAVEDNKLDVIDLINKYKQNFKI